MSLHCPPQRSSASISTMLPRTEDIMNQVAQYMCRFLAFPFLAIGTTVLAMFSTAVAETLVVDNTDVAFSIVSGSWTASTTVPGFEGSNYLHDGNAGGGSEVQWDLSPSSPSSKYSVFARWAGGTNRATNAGFIITSATGDELVVKSQRQGGAYVLLGEFTGPTRVRLLNSAADGFVIADAVKIVRIGGSPLSGGSAGYGPGTGTDMWTTYIAEQNLYSPHEDDCDAATEVFVEIASSGRGFCMEVNERTAATWEEARDSCATDLKRLPEAVEWKIACRRSGSSFNQLLDGIEWVGNTATLFWPNAGAGSLMAAIVGFSPTCASISVNYVGQRDSIESSHSYRCLR